VTLTDCLQCGYSRTGLAADAVCPECGGDAPDPSWIVVRGWSYHGGAWTSIVVGVGVALAVSLPVLLRGRPLQVPRSPVLIVVFIFSIIAIVRGIRLLRHKALGGDVLWVASSDGLLVRFGSRESRHSWREIKHLRVKRASMFSNWFRINGAYPFMSFKFTAPPHVYVRGTSRELHALVDNLNRSAAAWRAES
jgi:hypothetical protein